MIAATIGRKFLEVYNQEYRQTLSAKEFFEQQYFPLFYNHSKYMQWVTNSPFVQMKKGQKPHLLTVEERVEKLENLFAKVSDGVPDASIAIGFPASEEKEFATTSGQVTDLTLPIDEEDVYMSWIGSGLGVGIAGGLSILFDNPTILLALYNGWSIYRNYLNDTAYISLRGNQINTWNGQWLAHRFGKNYYEDDPTLNLSSIAFNTKKDGTIEVVTQTWVKVLFGIARKFPNQTMMGYVYNLGQTNKTIGFVPFQLPQINRPVSLYRQLFGENEYLNRADLIEDLYGSAFSFQRACQMGSIGVQALEPKGLRGLIPDSQGKAKMPKYKGADEKKIVTYKTYITWLLAMLNNKDRWKTAGEAADILLNYQKGGGTKTTRKNNVKKVLDAPSAKQFIESLIKLVEEAEDKEGLAELAELADKTPHGNFSYLLTLIRFRYAEKDQQTSN